MNPPTPPASQTLVVSVPDRMTTRTWWMLHRLHARCPRMAVRFKPASAFRDARPSAHALREMEDYRNRIDRLLDDEILDVWRRQVTLPALDPESATPDLSIHLGEGSVDELS